MLQKKQKKGYAKKMNEQLTSNTEWYLPHYAVLHTCQSDKV